MGVVRVWLSVLGLIPDQFSGSNKKLIIRLITTYRCRKMVFHYTLQHVSAVQISHLQEDVGYKIRNKNGERERERERERREGPLDGVRNYNSIITVL